MLLGLVSGQVHVLFLIDTSGANRKQQQQINMQSHRQVDTQISAVLNAILGFKLISI